MYNRLRGAKSKRSMRISIYDSSGIPLLFLYVYVYAGLMLSPPLNYSFIWNTTSAFFDWGTQTEYVCAFWFYNTLQNVFMVVVVLFISCSLLFTVKNRVYKLQLHGTKMKSYQHLYKYFIGAILMSKCKNNCIEGFRKRMTSIEGNLGSIFFQYFCN